MALFDELLMRLARGEKLSETDLGELRLAALDIDRMRNIVGGWIGSDGQPNVKAIRAERGRFEITPVEHIHVERISAQSIPNNTETPITFTGVSIGSEIFQGLSTQINFVANSSRVVGVMGTIQWAAASAGRRAIHANFYDSGGVQLYGTTLHSRLPTNIGSDTIPFSTTLPLLDFEGTEVIKLTCLQTSGGALDVEYFQAGLFLVR
jgi:hypothetical protein